MSASLPSFPPLPVLAASFPTAEESCLAQVRAVQRAATLASTLGHATIWPYVRIESKCYLYCDANSTVPVEHNLDTLPVSKEDVLRLEEIVPSSPIASPTALLACPAQVEWMLDSGAALDLVSRRQVAASGLSEHPTHRPIQLQTAAGPVTVQSKRTKVCARASPKHRAVGLA